MKFYDIDKERKFFGGLIRNQDIFKRIYLEVVPLFFHNQYLRVMYEQIIQCYNTSYSRLTIESLIERLSRQKDKIRIVDDAGVRRTLSEIDIKKIEILWKRCHCEAKHISETLIFEYCETLKKYSIARQIRDSQLTIVNHLNKGDVEAAANLWSKIGIELEDSSSKIANVSLFDTYSLLKKEYRLMKEHPELFSGISTGIDYIDRNIDGGLRRSELGLITAATGRGKSILLSNIALWGWLQNKNVMYVTIEMKGIQSSKRIWCRITGIPYKKFRRGEFTLKELNLWKEKYQELKKSVVADFRIIDVPENCTIDLIKSIIREQNRKQKVDLVVIDYLNIMAGGRGGDEYDWKIQTLLCDHLHQKIARFFDVPVWTATQLAGASENKTFLTQGDIGFGKSIANSADIGIWIAQNEDMRIFNKANIGFFKTRDVSFVPHEQILTNFNYMSFGDVSYTIKVKIPEKEKKLPEPKKKVVYFR